MATLYRPTVTRRKDGTKYTEKTRNWWCRFRPPGASKPVSIKLETSDREIAKKRARRIELEYERASQNPYKVHHETPLEKHLDDYNRFKLSQVASNRCKSTQHVATAVSHVRKVLDDCGFVYWPDIAAERFEAFIADLHADGMKTATCNQYISAFKAFLTWLVKNDRADRNPVQYVERGSVERDAVEYRELSDDEMTRLLEATLNGPTLQGVSGYERWVLYRLASETGFRLGEARTLVWGRIDLNADPATATVMAAHARNGTKAVQPLNPSTARMLTERRDHLGSPADDGLVFPDVKPWYKAAEHLRTDCEAAGIEHTTTDPETGEVIAKLVFHGTRHTYISNVDRHARSRSVTQRLARHKSYKMTDCYTHPRVDDQQAAVDALPIPKPDADPEQVRATGTEGGKACCTIVAPNDGNRCLSVSAKMRASPSA